MFMCNNYNTKKFFVIRSNNFRYGNVDSVTIYPYKHDINKFKNLSVYIKHS